jgi:7-cyano-7-deazaguanine synthase
MMKGLVMLSGGLDSATCMAVASVENEDLIAISFDYGQRHRRELENATRIAAWYQAEHIVVQFDARKWGGSALTDDIELPRSREIDNSIPATYVPARNTIFLAFALAIAEVRNVDRIYIGVNALDYSGYPDCRPEFIEAFQRMANLAQKRAVEGRPVQIQAPLIHLTKAEIIQRALELGAPLELSWSCYEGSERPCGECDSCTLRAKGFEEVGVADPALTGVA